MKTKAEAIANPEAGDRWERDGCLKVLAIVPRWQAERIMIIHQGKGKSRKQVQYAYFDGFRRWAANATYLGGRDGQ